MFDVKPLNVKEKKWLEEAQKLFDSQPKRFKCLTIGNSSGLEVIDTEFATESANWRDGISLGIIRINGSRLSGN